MGVMCLIAAWPELCFNVGNDSANAARRGTEET